MKSHSSSRSAQRSAASTSAPGASSSARSRRSRGSDPALTPMRIATGTSGSPATAGTRAAAAASTISRTCFSAIVPGLMRTPAAPASIAASARRQS